MASETKSASRPIEAVGTAVAAFVGLAEDHPALTALGAVLTGFVGAVIVQAVRGRTASRSG